MDRRCTALPLIPVSYRKRGPSGGPVGGRNVGETQSESPPILSPLTVIPHTVQGTHEGPSGTQAVRPFGSNNRYEYLVQVTLRMRGTFIRIVGGAIGVRYVVFVSVVVAVVVFADARKRMSASAAIAWAIAALTLVGIAVPLYLIVRPSRQAATWGFGEVAGVTLLVVGAWLAATLALLVSPLSHTATLLTLSEIVVLSSVQSAISVAAGLYLVLIKYRIPLASLGLRMDHARRRVWQGLAGAAALRLGNAIGVILTIFLLGLWMGHAAAAEFVAAEQKRTAIYGLLPHLHTVTEIALLGLVFGIVVPIGEEIFFRGLVLGALRRALDRHVAVVVSAIFFAVAHLTAVELLPLLIGGLVLGYLYDRTGSLVPGMIAHGMNNLVVLAFYYWLGPAAF